MRAVRFTKAEAAWIRAGLSNDDLIDAMVRGGHKLKDRMSLLEKLSDAEKAKATGVNAGAFEAALIGAARGKVVPVESSAYPRVSRQATSAGATPELAAVVGAWLAAQSWMRGPLTVFTVLNKWPDWLARAKATAAPDGLEPGLGPDLGPGATQKRPATTAGRRAPGIG